MVAAGKNALVALWSPGRFGLERSPHFHVLCVEARPRRARTVLEDGGAQAVLALFQRDAHLGNGLFALLEFKFCDLYLTTINPYADLDRDRKSRSASPGSGGASNLVLGVDRKGMAD